MKWIVIALGILLAFAGCVSTPQTETAFIPIEQKNTMVSTSATPEDEFIQEDESETPQETVTTPGVIPVVPSTLPVDPNAKPVLYNLGVHFGPWNKQTNSAGDFRFRKGLFDEKIFLESGAYVVGSNGPKRIPELTFHLPEKTKIFSPVNGIVTSIQKLYSNDYAVNIQTSPSSNWLVTFEHLENISIAEGQSVEVGMIIGDASTFGGVDGMAFTELVVWKGGATENDIIKLCPVPLLDSSVRAELESQIIQLAKDWETYLGKNVYAEEEWPAPGCVREQMTEYEAMNP